MYISLKYMYILYIYISRSLSLCIYTHIHISHCIALHGIALPCIALHYIYHYIYIHITFGVAKNRRHPKMAKLSGTLMIDQGIGTPLKLSTMGISGFKQPSILMRFPATNQWPLTDQKPQLV